MTESVDNMIKVLSGECPVQVIVVWGWDAISTLLTKATKPPKKVISVH